MQCTTCNGKGIIGSTLRESYCPTVVCSNCKGSGVDMSSDRQKTKEDMVNHPKHYTFGIIEVITVIDDWKLGFYEGQVIKYVGRAKHKGNELEDLKKAQWYLNRLIGQLTDQEKEK